MEGKPIDLTKEEVATVNILNGHIQSVQNELQKSIAAQADYIKLLELKYNARLDPESGSLYPLEIPWEEM